MISLPVKHSAAEVTIFSKMTSLALQHKAINLSQGFPDFPIDELLCAYLHEGAQAGFNQYAPMTGLPMLTEAIAKDIDFRYSLQLDPATEITVTPGATYAIYTALAAVLKAGDEAIFFEPAYDSYLPGIELNGGVPIPIPLLAPSYKVDWDQVKERISPRTKVIIVNTPHNPTGTCFSIDDWNALAEMVMDTDIIVIADEVYEQMIFDNQPHYSVMVHPVLSQRAFAVFSFGKVFNNTGWKMGYVAAPSFLTHAFRKVHQYLVFTVNAPAQYALARHLSNRMGRKPGELMQEKRDFFLEGLKNTPFTIFSPSGGSYFQLVSYENVSELPEDRFAEWLTKEHGVASIPVSAFYHNRTDNRLLRFCFSKKEETLTLALERLAAL